MHEVVGIFGHKAVEKLFQIMLRGRVGVFHDHDAATGVLNKDGDRSVSYPVVIDLQLHVLGDFIKALAPALHFELVVVNVHCDRPYACSAVRSKSASKQDYSRQARWRRPVTLLKSSQPVSVEYASGVKRRRMRYQRDANRYRAGAV